MHFKHTFNWNETFLDCFQTLWTLRWRNVFKNLNSNANNYLLQKFCDFLIFFSFGLNLIRDSEFLVNPFCGPLEAPCQWLKRASYCLSSHLVNCQYNSSWIIQIHFSVAWHLACFLTIQNWEFFCWGFGAWKYMDPFSGYVLTHSVQTLLLLWILISKRFMVFANLLFVSHPLSLSFFFWLLQAN